MQSSYRFCLMALGGIFLAVFGFELATDYEAMRADEDANLLYMGTFDAVLALFMAVPFIRPSFLDRPKSLLGCAGSMVVILFATCMFFIFCGYQALSSPVLAEGQPLDGDVFNAWIVLGEFAIICLPIAGLGLIALILAPFVARKNANALKQNQAVEETAHIPSHVAMQRSDPENEGLIGHLYGWCIGAPAGVFIAMYGHMWLTEYDAMRASDANLLTLGIICAIPASLVFVDHLCPKFWMAPESTLESGAAVIINITLTAAYVTVLILHKRALEGGLEISLLHTSTPMLIANAATEWLWPLAFLLSGFLAAVVTPFFAVQNTCAGYSR